MYETVTRDELNTVVNNLNSNILGTGNNITSNLIVTANNLQANQDALQEQILDLQKKNKEPIIITYNYDFFYVNNSIIENNFPIPNPPPPVISPTKSVQQYYNVQPIRDYNDNIIDQGFIFTIGKQFGDLVDGQFVQTDRFYQEQSITINDESMLTFGGFFNQDNNNTVHLPCNSGTGIFKGAKEVIQSYPSDGKCINKIIFN